jgi:hypothetical protein
VTDWMIERGVRRGMRWQQQARAAHDQARGFPALGRAELDQRVVDAAVLEQRRGGGERGKLEALPPRPFASSMFISWRTDVT